MVDEALITEKPQLEKCCFTKNTHYIKFLCFQEMSPLKFIMDYNTSFHPKFFILTFFSLLFYPFLIVCLLFFNFSILKPQLDEMF